MTDQELMEACGGRPIMEGGERVMDFGFRPSDPSVTALATVPFDATEEVPEIAGDKVFLWEYARIANGGKPVPYNWQVTGSCVNGGFQNAGITRAGFEIIHLPAPEVFEIPFTLHVYGYSRFLFGDNSEGEGSTGDNMAKAGQLIGVTGMYDPNVPKPTFYKHAFVYPSNVEYKFSAWKNCPESVKAASKPHPFQFSIVKTLEEAEKELRRGRPLTWAGNWGGRMECGYKGSGENRVLWNGERVDTWNHQESVLGVWINPELGRLWYVQNQWFMLRGGDAVSVHGEPANGEPPGGYWIGDAAMSYQLNYRYGEVRALKDFSGFTKGLIHLGNV